MDNLTAVTGEFARDRKETTAGDTILMLMDARDGWPFVLLQLPDS